MDGPHFIIHSSTDGHWRLFHVLASVNNGAVIVGVQVSESPGCFVFLGEGAVPCGPQDLVPQLGIEGAPSAVKEQCGNHRDARDPCMLFLKNVNELISRWLCCVLPLQGFLWL